VNINRSDETGRWQAANIDETLLRQKYVDEKKTMEQTAKEMGISLTAVYNRLKKLELRRSHRDSGLMIYGKEIVLDEEKIKSMYVDSKRSTNSIATEFGVSGSTIYEIVRKLGVVRPREEALSLGWTTNTTVDTDLMVKKYTEEGKTCHEISKEMGIDAFIRLTNLGLMRSYRAAQFNRWQGKVPNIDEEQIVSMYINSQMSFAEIAKECGISCTSVFNTIKKIDNGRNEDEQRALSRRRMVSANLSPNRTELRIDRLIQSICPNEFIFNDDTKRVSIAGKYPDWYSTNGQHKLIEYNGCYPHACPQCFDDGIFFGKTAEQVHKRDTYKLLVYDKHGYLTLVVWGHDTDEDIIGKLRVFIQSGAIGDEAIVA